MKTVAVILDGERTVHMHHTNGNYATLCGLDGEDATLGMEPAKAIAGEKINCADCRAMWKVAHAYKASDFEVQP